MLSTTTPNKELTRIDREHINELPLAAYEGTIEIINHQDQVQSAVEALFRESCLGFDTESRPSFKKGDNFPISLIQLAASDKVYLFQLECLQDFSLLWTLFSTPKIAKVGVALHDDIKKLQERYPLKAAGFVEISDHTVRHGILNTGLRSLVAHFLHFRISKRAQVSNWARKELTEAQIQYAATDAWVSRELYLNLLKAGIIRSKKAVSA